MKRTMNPTLNVCKTNMKVSFNLLLALFIAFSVNKSIMAGDTTGKRTVIEYNPVKKLKEYATYKYYNVLQWELDNCPKIISQGIIDSKTGSFKAVFNIQQNEKYTLFVTEDPIIVDELYNLHANKGNLNDLYLEPGDSISFNGDIFGYISGKGANNNTYENKNNFDIRWPDPTRNDYSKDYINFWLAKLNAKYNQYELDLEQNKSNISTGLYNYLTTNYKYNILASKVIYLLHYIESYQDSLNYSKTKIFENVSTIEKLIIPEIESKKIINDNYINNNEYNKFIYWYMIYQLSLKTQKFHFYYFEPDQTLFKLSQEKLPPLTRQFFNSYILINILGAPDKKESVRPFYEAHLNEFPNCKFNDKLTKAYNSRANIAKGKVVPDFSLKDHNGKIVSLSSFKGKNVCLYFYEDNSCFPEYHLSLSAINDLVKIYIYLGTDTSLFSKNVKIYPDAIHLRNINWHSAKEYCVGTFQFGQHGHLYILDGKRKLKEFMYPGSFDELDFYLYNIFYKNNNPSKTTSNIWIIIITIIGSIISFGAISWAVIRYRARIIRIREEKKRKLIEMELRGIRAQMNPHFMFNSLSSIQNLINQSKVQEANLYLTKFADLMRLVLSNSEKSLIPIADEIEAVRTYCELERLRFDFIYSIEIDKNLDIYNTEIPGMLIQPYVENAILHGINYLEDRKGILTIKLELANNILKCAIDDNGIGRKASEALKSEKTQKTNGFGIRLAKERLDLLNSQFKDKITISITDKIGSDGECGGTLVEIGFPVEN